VNWRAWLKGLAAAAIGGAAASATQMLSAQGTVPPKQLGIGAGVGAITTVAAYLLHPPTSEAGK
jgi:hypothetical protein